jgi:hypothetical protein
MLMVTGIVIPHETRLSMQKVEFEKLIDYQTAVGGYIEVVHIDGHPLAIVADEEGKIKRLPLNRRATCLWWLLAPYGAGDDVLVGDVVILGGERASDLSDAPANLVSLLLETKRFQVQVCLSQELNTWVPMGDPVDDFFEAVTRALALIGVWDPPHEVKVVAAD